MTILNEIPPTHDLMDLTVETALQNIFQTCRNHNKLAIGFKEVVKSLYRSKDDENKLKLVVVAKDTVPNVLAIIEYKCRELNIPMIFLETNQELGKIAPIKKVKNMSAIGIRDFICESREKAFIARAYNNN